MSRATAESRPTLYRLAAERQYQRIPEHVTQFPADVLWQDRYGSTPLHLLCQVRDIDYALLMAVHAILDVLATMTTTATTIVGGSHLVAQRNVAGWTPLHLACEKRLHSGGGSSTRNSAGDNGTLRYSNRELVLTLIAAYPPAVSVRMNNGYKTNLTPFHIACENNAHVDVLRAMLHVNPQLAIESYTKQQDMYSHTDNTIQLLWAATQKNSSRPHNAGIAGGSSDSNAATTNTMDDIEGKIALLLEAVYCGSVAPVQDDTYDHDDETQEANDDPFDVPQPPAGVQVVPPSLRIQPLTTSRQQGLHPSFRLLNAACSVRCPREYISRILQRHPEQASELDETGQLPLHYACRSAQLDAQSYTEFVVESLLESYPEAASISFPIVDHRNSTSQGKESADYQQQQQQNEKILSSSSSSSSPPQVSSSLPSSPQLLPLHVLLTDSRMTWHKGGVQALVSACPDALRIPDPRNKLPPFLASAVNAINSRLHLSTTYELLLAAPEMIIIPDSQTNKCPTHINNKQPTNEMTNSQQGKRRGESKKVKKGED